MATLTLFQEEDIQKLQLAKNQAVRELELERQKFKQTEQRMLEKLNELQNVVVNQSEHLEQLRSKEEVECGFKMIVGNNKNS